MACGKNRRTSHIGSGGILSTVGGLASTVLNKGIDLLPVELHIPGYRYCGPGTRLKERLARGDRGINQLDEACKEHDIVYSKFTDNQHRSQADKELADRAWARVKSPDASLGEKAAAWSVTSAMKAKAKMGGDMKKKQVAKTSKKGTVTKKTKGHRLPPYKKGQGYYLQPYKKGHGYYLKPYKGSGKKKTLKKKKASR